MGICLRFQSLISILEENQFKRVSLNGLKTDHVDIYNGLVKLYEDVEAFDLLDILVNKSGTTDEEFMIWLKSDGSTTLHLPFIIEIKESYSETECDVFSSKTKIPKQHFVTVANATV